MIDRVGQQFGNYRLIRLLGRGGFAEVYLGEHIYLQSQAAIKVLHAPLSNEHQENFLREARQLSRLKHPYVVRLFDFGIEGETPFLVMEYAPNGSLRTRHPKGSQIPLETSVIYVKQVANALQYVHSQGLVHRDIKPENLLLGSDQEVLLSDLGVVVLAHTTGSLITQEQAGTPSYMAPEQIEGRPRPASDQYALGIVVYEWLCGACPFEGSALSIMVQHLHTPPLALHQHLPNVPPLVEAVVLKALAKDPKQRFAHVEAFATALEEANQKTEGPSVTLLHSTSPPLPPRQQPLASPPPMEQVGQAEALWLHMPPVSPSPVQHSLVAFPQEGQPSSSLLAKAVPPSHGPESVTPPLPRKPEMKVPQSASRKGPFKGRVDVIIGLVLLIIGSASILSRMVNTSNVFPQAPPVQVTATNGAKANLTSTV